MTAMMSMNSASGHEVIRIDHLMRLMAERAGARRALFMSVHGTDWSIESAVGPGGGVPKSVVDKAICSRERIIMEDAAGSEEFCRDPYIVDKHPRSVACLPVVREPRLIGVVYLENDLIPGAFTQSTVLMVELLADQIALTFENAKLHGIWLREIIERQQAESALRSILDNMVDVVFLCDRAGRITLTNRVGLNLFGFSTLPESMPMPVEELARRMRPQHFDGRPFTVDELPLLRALAGEVLSSVEMTAFHTVTGRAINLRVSAAPLQNEWGAISGAVAVAVNQTEATELERLKEEFIRVVAHELKTPITIVKGYADALRHTDTTRLVEPRLLDALVRGADRIDRLVTDLLMLWQLQTGRLVLAVEEGVDLAKLIGVVVRRLEQKTARRVSIATTQPAVVAADRQLVERALVSLVDNALRYSPPSSSVEVELREWNGGVRLDVRDHGVGIPADRQARLFEPFFRAHSGTCHDTGGLGIGLYLAKAIATMHGGSLVVESREREGSTFRLMLPRRAAGMADTS